MRTLFLSFLTFIIPVVVCAQSGSSFRSASNPHYWKNRKPFEGYWQQDIHYNIDARVDEQTDVIEGKLILTYWNNSPDELKSVYFHLYQNAFTRGSYYESLNKGNNIQPKFGVYEDKGLGTEIKRLESEGKALNSKLDNTILKVELPRTLASGDSIVIEVDFNTYFQNNTAMRRRMKMFNAYGYKHYDGVHWYPRVCVYDRKLGWDLEQHLEKEFYGDFGSYDVSLDLANNFVLDATGVLQNPDEVLPKSLRDSLDIKRFANKPMYSPPSVITKYKPGIRKVWKFKAVNVHDFAWTADPTYRIGEADWMGIKIIALCQEPHASRWQNAASFTADVIRIYSTDFGMYVYPKMIVADARDGMEYPMLTLDGGEDPGYRDLIAHEVGHNWFFGMIGTNETYRAALDEGFTQFLTCWAMEKIDGLYRVQNLPKNKYVQRHRKPDLIRNSEVYAGYLFDFEYRDEVVLNTQSSMFGTAMRHGGGYRQVYTKTATMLYNLQYVLGDELFLKAMQNYFDDWKICHPYWEDFKASVTRTAGTDLSWFFDQWFDTPKTLDYGITSLKKGKEKGEYQITFVRKGDMQMPIDFAVVLDNDSLVHFHIPNTDFIKETKALVLPKWYGWMRINPEYTATIKVTGKVKDVLIDPTHRLADIWMLDNSKKFPLSYMSDSRIYNMPDWKSYELRSRPEIWYNGFDGVKAGLHFNGSYMGRYRKFESTIWFNTQFGQMTFDSTVHENDFDNISFRFHYSTPTEKISKNSSASFTIHLLDGLNMYQAGFVKKDRKNVNTYYASYKSMIRYAESDLTYLLNKEWLPNMLNNTVTLGMEHPYDYTGGNGTIHLSLRSSTLMSDFNSAAANLTVMNRNKLGKKINLNTRVAVRYSTGTQAPESELYLAGASPEEMMDNKFTRSIGFFPSEWAGYGGDLNHFHHGGGLNLRGYAGYLAPEETGNGGVVHSYRGHSGASVNAELEFDNLFRGKGIPKFFRRKLGRWKFANAMRNTFRINTYLFGDAGVISYSAPGENLMLTDLRADAGLGIALTIKKWAFLETVDPLTIRFDMPLFLNRIPYTETDYFAFRWVLGVNRAF
ncbi:MAG: M1 family metallopeptidase [Bacteroidia bacterium]|nr:M1 family metallopeptidase [Bacteroidia bacterium]